MKSDQSDSAVTSVVGEMLVLVLVILLVSLFALSAFSLLPGERETYVTVALDEGNATHLLFWHKGGDWVEADELSVTATSENGTKLEPEINGVYNGNFSVSEVFDLGGCFTIPRSEFGSGVYDLRITTADSIIFSRDEVNIL